MEKKGANAMEENELFESARIVADPGQNLLRIDRFLLDRLPNVSRSKIQEGIENGMVTVNGKAIKSNYKIKPLDEIIIYATEPIKEYEVLPENIPLDIVYEDADILIINKVAGMVVHPAYNNWTGTLVNALVYHFRDLPVSAHSDFRPGLVHRIDKETSGLLVVAKTETAMTHLAKQFFDHTIDRIYNAIVWGVPKEEQGAIDSYIGRSYADRRVMTVFPEQDYGKRAITHYKVLQNFRYVSLIECKLETGRTHQIRVHMKHLGHPLFNDAVYGGDKILRGTEFSKYRQFVQNCFQLMPRQALHAKTLGFVHPTTKEYMHFECPLPTDFEQVLEKWEQYVKYN